MKISNLKNTLSTAGELRFILPDGKLVPLHFHITEVGVITKNFIDCGGTVREEKVVSLQLWEAMDFHHRLKANKLLDIIEKAESLFEMKDLEIEVEYQAGTIGKFGLDYKDGQFLLTNKKTACLALENCGNPLVTTALKVVEAAKNCCTPGSGCC